MGRKDRTEPEPGEPRAAVRLDVFLDVACLFRTRSQAAAACNGGKVDLNGHAAAPHKVVRPGDTLEITFEGGRRRFLVKEIAEHHIPKAQARTLFEETTPPPSPEVLEARRLERLLAPRHEPGRPSRRDRDALRRMKGR